MPYLLGLDVGSTNLKAMLYDLDGCCVGVGSQPTITHSPRQGWAHYRAEEIWSGMSAAIKQAISAVEDAREIVAIGAASMGEAGVPLDAEGQPLYDILAWFDIRTEAQSQWWEQECGRYAIYQITGQTIDPTYSINKIMWLRDNEPDVFRRLRTWLCMEDYVVYMLSGVKAAEFTVSSRTMVLDQKRRAWSEELCRTAGVDVSIFPDLYPSGTVVGYVTNAAAEATGLVAGTPVALGGHDHLCGALAAHVYRPGDVLDSTGTSEAMVVVLDKPILTRELCDAHYTCYSHVARDRYILLGQLNTSGGLIDWFRQEFCAADQAEAAAAGKSVYDLLMAKLSLEPGARGIISLPYFGRGATPHWNPSGSFGAFAGLTTSHTRIDMLQAVIEGTCYSLRENLEYFESILGRPIPEITAIGGATRNRYWMDAKAAVTGRPVEIPALQEATPLGAALLAGIASGCYSDEEDAVRRVYRVDRRIEPEPLRAAKYDELYRRVYGSLYASLEQVHEAIDASTKI